MSRLQGPASGPRHRRGAGPDPGQRPGRAFGRAASRIAGAGLLALALAPGVASAQQGSALSAVWANEGGDKVLQHERRAAAGPVNNAVWDGTTIRVFGARNEVVNFNLVLESAAGARDVAVRFNRLAGPDGAAITSPSVPVTGDGVFNYVGRNIEVFVVRYLQIKGLSRLSYEAYDERHVPSKMRRPGWDANGFAPGGWQDRPGADKFFPEIAVPHELQPTFAVAAGQNQSVWIDVYVPKGTAPGRYTGTISIVEQGRQTRTVPVELTVRNITLPDQPAARTMLAYGPYDISERYTGARWADPGTPALEGVLPVLQRHWHVMRRHKITPIHDFTKGVLPLSQDALERLSGAAYTAARGYDGPGQGLGDNVYSVGFYGNWSWKDADQATYNRITDEWETWFRRNAPNVERFLYLVDEPDWRNPDAMATINRWLDKLTANPGVGRNLKTYVTMSTQHVVDKVPRVNIASNWYEVADTGPFQAAVDRHLANPANSQHQYNGKRPATGSFAIEDDGVSPRMLGWAQWKKGIGRWFFWESTYYYDFQTKAEQVNVWQNANTYGKFDRTDPVVGRTGFNYSNGDGVLLYPGTDRLFPADSLGVNGPIASLRLKYWRRGIQDVDYIALANSVDPEATRAIVQRMVPKVLWEIGVQDPADPSWVRSDISWSIDPDVWEQARRQLADIIEGKPRPRSPTLRVSEVAAASD